jgi:hypothetical protein
MHLSGESKVSLDSWIEYYTTVSASIEDDDYFESMMNKVWNLDGEAQVQKQKTENSNQGGGYTGVAKQAAGKATLTSGQ